MRVLLLAEDCNPEWPSLPVVGYNAALAIADVVDVVLATQVRNRPSLEKHGTGGARVEYIDTEYIARPLYKLAKSLRGGTSAGWTTATALAYPGSIAFDREVWSRFRPQLEAGEFDVVHRLTPMSPTLPSPIAKWTPTPFVLGPLNGGLAWPAEFAAEFRREKEYARKLRGLHKYLPYYKSTLRSCDAVLASFRHTWEDLPSWAHSRTINFPEVGVDPIFAGASGERSEPAALTFLSVGRFVPLKLFDVVLRALANSPVLRKQRLVMIGDGMERKNLEDLARELGVASAVEFVGWLAQRDVAEYMRKADVFVFPSVRELGGGVVVEAMAAGCVPVVVDYGGPGELVGDGRGTKLALGCREELVAGLTKALERYVHDRALLRAQSTQASTWVLDHLTWSAKAKKTEEIYQWVLGRRLEKPELLPHSRSQ